MKELRTEWCQNEGKKGLVHAETTNGPNDCMRHYSFKITTVDAVVEVVAYLQSRLYRATAGGQRVLQDERFELLYKTGQHRRAPHVVARENGYREVQSEDGSHTDN